MRQSTIGNFLRKVADDCDRSCGGTSGEDFEKMAELQLRDHEDIKLLMNSVAGIRRELDDMKKGKKDTCRVVNLKGHAVD